MSPHIVLGRRVCACLAVRQLADHPPPDHLKKNSDGPTVIAYLESLIDKVGRRARWVARAAPGDAERRSATTPVPCSTTSWCRCTWTPCPPRSSSWKPSARVPTVRAMQSACVRRPAPHPASSRLVPAPPPGWLGAWSSGHRCALACLYSRTLRARAVRKKLLRLLEGSDYFVPEKV
jgi:hypothetical protein